MAITFNDPNRGSTFGNLFSDTNFTQDTWYRLWTGNEDGSSGSFVDTSRFYGQPEYESVSGNGWIQGKDLYQMEITFAQAGHTHLWVRNFEETQNLPQDQRWTIGEMDFSVVKDHQVDDGIGSDDSINPGQTGPFIREEVTEDTPMLQMFNIGTLTEDHWIRLWVGNEAGTVGEFIDTSAFNEYGKGWLQPPDLDQLMFEAPELGESVELWVTTWTEENKYADWKHWTVTTVETDPEDLNPGETFTLIETYDSEDSVILDASNVEPYIQEVIYWGDPEGNHVPGEMILGVLDELAGFQLETYENFDFLRLLEQIEAITDSGVLDDLQGGNDGQTIVNVDAEGNITVEEAEGGGAGDYTGTYKIVINLDDANTTMAQIALTQIQFEYLTNMIFDANGNSRLFTKEIMVYPQVPLLDSDGEPVLDINGNQIPVNLTSVVEEGDEFQVPILLTPEENNGGTVEEGFTGDGDDVIVAGRLELLHQAYIDGGAGRDTLEIDAKGYYAQPLALLNIEDVKVQNLPNVYTLSPEGDADVYDVSEMTAYPDLANNVVGFTNSVIDLSRATAIETLTVTEGDFEGLEDIHVDYPGTLTVTGIRNGAETTLDGNFLNNLKLNFGELQGSGLNLVFNNLSMGDSEDEDGPQLLVGHNADTLNIKSTGGGNFLYNADLGGQLSVLNISGDAHLYIADDLDMSFHDENPVTINAATNSGGVNLNLTWSDEVTFIGSKGNDRFEVDADISVTITGGTGDNAYVVDTETAIITNSDGNNYYEVIADVASLTVGNGNNEFDLDVDQTTIVAGDGDNVISAEDADAVVIEAGDGDNEITADGTDFVDITLGAGDNQVSSVESGAVFVETGDGSNRIMVSAEMIDIATGAGDDLIMVSGKYDAVGVSGAPTALLMIDAGAGEDRVVLGRDYETDDGEGNTVEVEDGITALEGSFITGENITLLVNNPSDLRAAELSGITSVVLNNDVEDSEILTLTAAQFAAIGAENFSVDGSIFHTHAYIKIIAQEDISLTDIDVSSLPRNIDLFIEINDGVTVTLTAEQLHKWVAFEGITLTEDGNTDDANGKVVIEGGGLNFDPFNDSDATKTIIAGTEYVGGSLSGDFNAFNVTVKSLVNGWDRPADVPAEVVITLDTTGDDTLVQGAFSTWHYNLEILGDQSVQFTDGAIALGLLQGEPNDSFTVDFSQLDGDAIDLTLANFEMAEQIIGNGDAERDVRVNVELGGQVGEPGLFGGLNSSGVQTYVVTDINGNAMFDRLTILAGEYALALTAYGEDQGAENTAALEDAYAALVQSGLVFGLNDQLTTAAAIATAESGQEAPSDLIEQELFNYSNFNYQEFYVCNTTQDLEVLGLQGNYDGQIHFLQVDRGVTFLVETEYNKFDGYVAGQINVNFAREGATADIAITNVGGDLPEDEQMIVNGFNLNNASDLDVSVTSGDVLIYSIWGSDQLNTLTFDAVGDVAVQQPLPASLTAMDMSGVVGSFTGEIQNPEGAFAFTGAQGGTFLTLDDLAAEAYVIDGGAAGAALTIQGEVHLTGATLTGISTVTLENGSELFINMPDADIIGAENFLLADGDAADLNLRMLSDEPFAIENYADGFSITITIANQPEVTLSADTDLTGIDALVVHEGTVLNLTAAQFQQLGDGEITGVDADGNVSTDFTVNITDLTQADLEGGLDLSGVAADNTTITLAESVELAEDDDLGGFDVIMGDEMTLALYLAQADELTVSGGLDTILQILDTTADAGATIDASGLDVGTLMMLNVLAAGHNVDLLFAGLLESVSKLIYNGLGWVEGVDQYVTVAEGTTVPGMLAFTRPEADTEIRNFFLTLEGGTEITGDLNLAGSDLEVGLQTHLQTVTINSFGTEANLLSGETANIIDGDITSQATAEANSMENNLLNVTINAEQELVVTGDVIFESVTLDDNITANDDDEAVAVLTVNGTADVSLGALDTSDDDVDFLNVVNNSTGTLSLTLDEAKLDADDELSLTGANIVVTVEGNVDLSDDDISGVSQLIIGDAGTVTLTQAQYEALGAASLLTDGTDGGVFTLHIVDFDGTVPFDATLIDEDITVASITMAAGDQVIDPATDLSNVGQIIVPEGGTLTLTAAQFQQLNLAGTITVLDTDGNAANDAITVNITGLTQADVDAGFDLSAIDDDADVTLTLAEDVNLADTTDLDDLDRLEVILADGQTLGLENSIQADGLVVTGGIDTTLVFQFAAMEGADTQIDASGYGVSVLKALATFVNGENVEFLLLNVPNEVEERYYVDPEELGFVSATHRVVVVEAGVTVDGYLMYNDPQDDREVRTLNLTLEGDATIDGDLNLSTIVKDNGLITRYFDTLTINSEGDEANVISGDVIATGADVSDTVVEVENNLLNVVINADQDLEIGGDIVFTSVDADDYPAATLTLTGDADVTVTELDLSDDEIDTLTIAHNGTGTFTATGASPGLGSDGNLENLILTGTGNLVFGTVGEGITADGLSSIDASGLSGSLDLGEVDDIDDANFAFTAGTGVTTLVLTSDTLDADVDADPAETGWSFDFSNAAAGSVFELGDVTWTDGPLDIDLGANTTLLITEDTDWTNLDLTLVQTQDIVLAKGVELIVTAEQAHGLNIVPAADVILDPNAVGYDAEDVPQVTIVEFGTQNYDFSGIDADISGTIHLVDDDVTAGAGADLGAFSVTLIARDDDNFTLTGQTIRFQTEEQAAREIIVVNAGGDLWDASGGAGSDDDDTTNSTNVVWLFDSVSGPVDTSEYDANLGRVWFTPELVNGANVEDLFNTLPDSILRVEFSSLEELDILLTSVEVHRTVELVAFTDLGDGLTFSDQDRLEHVASLTIQMGGQVNLGDLAIDNVVEPAAGVAVGAIEFDQLIINSHRALTSDHYLAPEGFDNDNDGDDEVGEHVQPANINVVGNIAVGDDDGLDLLTVTLNTLGVSVEDNQSDGAGADLQVGTITFDAEDADSVALLTVTGDNDTTIAAVNTDDPEIVTLTIDKQDGGILTITGASAAAAVGNTETLNIDVADGTVNLGTAGDPDKPGVSGADLSLIDVDGDGDANLGVIDLVDGEEFELNTTGNAGTVTATLAADNLGVPTLADGGEWVFNNTGAGNLELTFSDTVVLGEGDVTFNNVTLTIDGDVDFTVLDELTLGNTTIDVPAGSSLTILAEDADGLTITGDGTVFVMELEATDDADLSDIMTTDGDTGTVEAFVTTDDEADVDFTGELGKAHVTVSGDGVFDVRGGDLDSDPFDHDDDGNPVGGTPDQVVMSTFTVEADATLQLGAGQVDDRQADGAGTVELWLVGAPDDVNLSQITTDVVNAFVNNNEDFNKDADFGTAVITVADTFVLTVIGETVDGLTVAGAGTILVDSDDLDGDAIEDAINADFSNFTIEFITFAADALVDTITFPALYGDPTAVPAVPVQTVTLTSVQADGQVIVGATPGVTGAVLVAIDDTVDSEPDGDVDAFDLSGINAGTMTATINDTVDNAVVFDAAVDFGLFDIVITAGDAVTMTAAQADGLTITETGAATILITDLEDTPDADLSLVVVDVETAALDAEGDVNLGANLGTNMVVTISDSVAGASTVTFTGDMNSAGTEFVLDDDDLTLILDAADAHELTVTDNADDTAVIVNNLGGALVDFTGIAGDTLTANVPADATLDIASNLGDFDVVLAEGVTLGLTTAQLQAIGLPDISGTAGGVSEALVVSGYDGEAIDFTTLGPDVTVSELHLLNGADEFNINDVDATGADLSNVQEIVIPEFATLTITADQFEALPTGVISGAGTLHIVDLDSDNAEIDLSTVTAEAGTITLADVDTVVMAPAAVLDNSDGDQFDIAMLRTDGNDQSLTLSSETQADGRSVDDTAVTGDSVLVLGFTQADATDADAVIESAGFDVDELWIINEYLYNEFGIDNVPANFEFFLNDLDEDVHVFVYDAQTLLDDEVVVPDAITTTDRVVTIDQETLVDADVAFNDLDVDVEVRSLTLNLEGNSVINGDLTLEQGIDPQSGLPDTLPGFFKELVINSTDETGLGTAPNQIIGGIYADDGTDGVNSESRAEVFTLTLDPTIDVVGTEDSIGFDDTVIPLGNGFDMDDVGNALAAAVYNNWTAEYAGGVVTFTNKNAGAVTDVTLGDFTFNINGALTDGLPGTAAVVTTDQGVFNADENNLYDVTINADHDLIITGELEMSYVTRSSGANAETVTATLDIDVAAGQTVEIGSVNTDDVHIIGLDFTQTGPGTVNVPGLSPGAALGNTETLTITAAGVVNLGTDGDADKPGVSGADLSEIDVNGAGDVNLGVIALVDGLDFELDTQDNTGTVTATLSAELADGGEWVIDNTGAGVLELTIDGDNAVFGAGDLTLTNVALTIDGDVDFTNLTGLTIDGGTVFTIPDGQSLTITAALADGNAFEGAGTIFIVGDEEDAHDLEGINVANIDLSGIATAENDDVALDVSAFATDFTITGSDFDDDITTGAGADTIAGGDGDDTLNGGAGDDELTGGADDDTFTVTAGTDTVTDLETGDVLTVANGATANAEGIVEFVATADTQNDGTANLSAADGGAEIDVSAAVGVNGFNLTGGDGDDTLTGGAAADTLTGGEGDDILTGNAGNDIFNVDAGTDEIADLATGDAFVVSAGATVNADLTADFVATAATANDGTANLTLAEDVDADLSLATGTVGYTVTAAGNAAASVIIGSDFADTLIGGDGADELTGGEGDDELTGGAGDDTLTGGLGDDTFTVDAGTDDIDDLGGADVLVVSAGATAEAAVTADFTATADTANDGTANLTLANDVDADLSLATGTVGYTVTAAGNADASVIVGSDFADTLTGGDGADELTGGDGDDELTGGAGNDTLTGGLGDDTFAVDAGTDDIDDLGGADVLAVSAGATAEAAVTADFVATVATTNDGTATLTLAEDVDADLSAAEGTVGYTVTAAGNAAASIIIGSDFADTLIGGDGADVLTGGEGDDELTGGGGDDTLTGGLGDDTFTVDAGTDDIDDLGGADVLVVSAGATAEAAVTADFTATADTANDGTANLTLANDVDADLSLATGTVGYTVTAAGNADASVIIGSDFADTLTGGNGADELTGGDGDDELTGGGGDDTLTGGLGDDTLTGGLGDDTFAVDAGTDAIDDLGGADVLAVSAGATAEAAVTADFVATVATANDGTATLTLANDVDADLSAAEGTVGYTVTAAGNAAASVIIGSDFADTLTGGNGADELTGGDGDDELTGGGGDDTLTGGLGDDTLTGGLGDDTFAVDAGTDDIDDLGGADVLVVSAGATAEAAVTADFVATAATTNDGTATLTLANDVDANLNLAGGAAGYTVTAAGNAAASAITGSANADILIGGNGNDAIVGGAGADTITSGAGDDTLTGGAGLDTFIVSGGAANEVTDLGNGEIIQVAAGAGATADLAGSFFATAASSNDGDLTLNADNVGRFIDMSALGSTNNSGITINGNGGNDNITGTDYNDTISGGAGADVLTGGNGDDIFSYAAIGEGGDTIADFDTTANGIDSFQFAGSAFGYGLDVGALATGADATLDATYFLSGLSGTAAMKAAIGSAAGGNTGNVFGVFYFDSANSVLHYLSGTWVGGVTTGNINFGTTEAIATIGFVGVSALDNTDIAIV